MSAVLQGKVAIITGGTRGLGLGIAEAYAAAGAAVVIGSRSAGSVEAALTTLHGQGARAAGIPCDVGQLPQVEALLALALAEFGRLDVWVNNAGISPPYGPTAHVPLDQFEAAVRTNILGTYYGSVVALRHFLAQGRGKLINILGRGDKEPVPLQNAYAASKAWVRSFTLALAKEYATSGVGIFAFSPGLVQTDMMEHITTVAGYEARLAPLATVMRMWSNPPQVPAQRAVWLASAATDGRSGLEVRQLNALRIITGLLGEGWRRLRGVPAGPVPFDVTTLAPAIAHGLPRGRLEH